MKTFLLRVRATPAYLGIFYVLLYVLSASSNGVMAGHVMQSVDPFAALFVTFIIAAVFFQIISAKKGKSDYRAALQPNKGIFELNVSTLGAWLGYFYSVKFLEPAIVSTISVGFAPTAAVLWSFIREKNAIARPELMSSMVTLFVTCYLMHVSFQGNSAVGAISINELIKGGTAAIITSIFVMLTIIYSKKMSTTGVTTSSIMAHRFYILIPVAFFVAIYNEGFNQALIDNVPMLLVMAIFGVIVPLWFLQKGTKLLKPVIVLIIISMAPGYTYLIELLDPRLTPKIEVLLAITLLTSVAIYAVYIPTQHRIR